MGSSGNPGAASPGGPLAERRGRQARAPAPRHGLSTAPRLGAAARRAAAGPGSRGNTGRSALPQALPSPRSGSPGRRAAAARAPQPSPGRRGTFIPFQNGALRDDVIVPPPQAPGGGGSAGRLARAGRGSPPPGPRALRLRLRAPRCAPPPAGRSPGRRARCRRPGAALQVRRGAAAGPPPRRAALEAARRSRARLAHVGPPSPEGILPAR